MGLPGFEDDLCSSIESTIKRLYLSLYPLHLPSWTTNLASVNSVMNLVTDSVTSIRIMTINPVVIGKNFSWC
mgnify:CR=1 FL=1